MWYPKVWYGLKILVRYQYQSFISVKYPFLDTEQPSSCFSVKYRYWILLVCQSITEEEAVCYYCGGTQRTFPEEKKAFYLFVLAFWHPCQAVKSQRAKSNSKSENLEKWCMPYTCINKWHLTLKIKLRFFSNGACGSKCGVVHKIFIFQYIV